MTLGAITPAMRRWCRALRKDKVQWYRTRAWSYVTVMRPVGGRNPDYALVERMHDLGLFEWARIERADGSAYFKAALTEIGAAVGDTPKPEWEKRAEERGSTSVCSHKILREVGE